MIKLFCDQDEISDETIYSNENMVSEWEIVRWLRCSILLPSFFFNNEIECSQVQLDCLLGRTLSWLISFISHQESKIFKCKGDD